MKPILQHATEIEGGKRKLAKALGVSPSTITYWIGALPSEREAQLVKLYGRRKVKQGWKPRKAQQ